MLGLAEAVAEGAGLGLLPCFIARTIPDLVPLSDPIGDSPGALWILTHPDLRSTARVRVFMDHVGSEIAKRRPRSRASARRPEGSGLPEDRGDDLARRLGTAEPA